MNGTDEVQILALIVCQYPIPESHSPTKTDDTWMILVMVIDDAFPSRIPFTYDHDNSKMSAHFILNLLAVQA